MFEAEAKRSAPRTWVKFCGMRHAEDVAQACALGVDAVGFVFAERSPRRVSVHAADALRQAVQATVRTVALFMDQDHDTVLHAIDALRPDLLQFHGEEDAAFCSQFGVPYLKALAMGDASASDVIEHSEQHPQAAGFLFDGHARGEAGGSGRSFDWTRLPAGFARPWLLAGGLTPDNVCAAIAVSGCKGVDVSSGIESAPGVKDPERMRRFMTEVRRADAML